MAVLAKSPSSPPPGPRSRADEESSAWFGSSRSGDESPPISRSMSSPGSREPAAGIAAVTAGLNGCSGGSLTGRSRWGTGGSGSAATGGGGGGAGSAWMSLVCCVHWLPSQKRSSEGLPAGSSYQPAGGFGIAGRLPTNKGQWEPVWVEASESSDGALAVVSRQARSRAPISERSIAAIIRSFRPSTSMPSVLFFPSWYREKTP